MGPFFRFIKNIRSHGMEYATGRHYSKYQATVVNTEDPQGQGRVKVSCEQVTGRKGELSLWAYPSSDFAGPDKGSFFPPNKDDKVWVWFDRGDLRVPMFSGSWWGNRNQDRSAAGSQVPQEFATQGGEPTKRGIKTKAGHGLLFEDKDNEQKVELWTGAQGGAGTAATRHHQVLLSDKTNEEQIVVSSFKGHTSSWIDITGQEAIEHKSAKGHFIKISDAQDNIVIQLVNGSTIRIDTNPSKITVQTVGQQKAEFIDSPASINVQDANGNIVNLSPAGVSVTAPALVNVQAGGAANVTAGGAATVTAAGLLSLTGSGLTMVSSGGAPTQITGGGAANETFAGVRTSQDAGVLHTSIGPWIVTGAGIQLNSSLGPGTCLVGTLGVKYRLVDERFFDYLENHTHLNGNAGGPTGKPIQPVVPAAMSTAALRGN